MHARSAPPLAHARHPDLPCLTQARKKAIASLSGGFAYLERRLTGDCARPYDCTHELAVFKAVRIFDPSWAALHEIGAANIDSLAVMRCIAERLIESMKTELHTYLTLAADFKVDRADVGAFTESVLKFWRSHCKELPLWAEAARIVFAMSPNSASCERVVSRLASMFTPDQLSTLGDAMQASLMLSYNQREVG